MLGTNLITFFREQGQKETSLAGALSPVSKKKTGRAYVSLARAYSEKYGFCLPLPACFRKCTYGNFFFRRGKLAEALELYRRAEAYVPDNIKLKERWILFIIEVFLLKIEDERRRRR
jgi:kinesin family protein 22